MNRQIDEMAKDLCGSLMCDLETFSNCRTLQGNCSRCQRVAKYIYNAGYRRSSEVVDDVMKTLDDMGYLNIEPHAVNAVEAELKKKYESGGADDEGR